MAILIPVASGKGGVGKTVCSANLGAALAQAGKTVVLVDLDLGGANLHTTVGVRNTHPGVGSVVWKKEKSISALIISTGIDRLFLVPGDNLLPGTANLEFFTKKRIMKELQEITADYVIMDLGAGSSYNIIDFWLMAPFGLLVSAPEIPSILNAYSFLKTAAFRMLFRSFSRGSGERERIVDFVVNKMEGHGETFMQFAQKLAVEAGPKGEAALAEISSLRPRVIINMGSGPADAGISVRLREISARNLGVNMDYIAYIMRDPEVSLSLGRRELLFLSNPESPFCRGIARAAERIIATPELAAPALELDDEDLFALMEKTLASYTGDVAAAN